jgi:quinoprotein glucose dehydrogenase
MRALDRRLMLTTTIGGAFLASLPARAQGVRPADTEWPTYGGNLAYWRYAPLDQIDAANFNKLEVAWTFKTSNSSFSARRC